MFINRALLRFAHGVEKKIVKAVLFQLLITLLQSAIALSMSFLINQLLLDKYILRIKNIAIVSVIIFLYMTIKIMSSVNVRIVTDTGISIKENVRTKIMQKLFLMGPAYIGNMRTGFLTSTLTTRVEWLMNYYTKYMPVVSSAIINAIIFTIFLTYIDRYTGIVTFVSIIVMLCIPMLFFNIMKEKGRQEWDNHAKYYSECLDGIQGMLSLKAFNADKKYVKYIKKYGEDYRRSIMEHLRITIIEGTFLELFARIGTAVTLAILGWRSVYGYVDKSWLIIALFSVGATFSPMISLINAWHLGFQGVSGSYSIDDFLSIKVGEFTSNNMIPKKYMPRQELFEYMKKVESDDYQIPSEKGVNLVFENVSFRYKENEKNAIDNISFNLKKGDVIAFIGDSGSGKSTIVNLMAGFYRPQKGNITLNHKKLDNNNVGFFQNNISVVWQDNYLFSGTIYENLKMANPNATKIDIINASKEAMIHEIIMELPNRYETKVEELSSKFSMGERQRIAIARAILKNSPIIIFDEATSSLDRKNEIYIQIMIEKLKKDKAIFIIAHRLSTVALADQIYIMKKGKIIERGTHQNLLKYSQAYNRLIGGAM